MVNYFGLYVGNSTASIALFKEDGKVEILANEAGERVTAAVVTVNSDEKVVGSTAGATSYSLASCAVKYNKRLLDVTISDESMKTWISESLVKIDGETLNSLTYSVSVEDSKKPLSCSTTQIASLIFKKLYGIGVGGAPGQDSFSCVIAVPTHWDDKSRQIVADAATQAGWEVMQVINEPAAALLAYQIGFEKPPVDQIALVYRLGGVSCDATVVSIENGFQTIVSHVRDDSLGGKDIISVVTEHLCDEFKRKYYLDPRESRKAMWKLKIAAMGIIHTLSTISTSSRFIESVCDGVDFNPTISQARFEALLSPLIPKFTAPIHQALIEAGVEKNQISKVVLCGGVLKVPKMRSVVSSMFDCEICSGLNPDEVLACGAAQQAGLLAGHSDGLGITEASRELPLLETPVHVQVNDQEVVMGPGVMPISHFMNLSVEEPKVEISAKQEQPSDSFIGQGVIECSEAGDLEIHIRLTVDNELVAEAVNTETKELQKVTFALQPVC
ncbi:hypothetical protein GE061_008001 [Apolygus lucorum]|uniref:Uncharacterized protein n=1 Tax=Apolygus lucorum TaxID=248454 RepID=A0A6A4J392_APOLU|nr:hypothetical protein GE061_008001 [Apolygus lucorum]